MLNKKTAIILVLFSILMSACGRQIVSDLPSSEDITSPDTVNDVTDDKSGPFDLSSVKASQSYRDLPDGSGKDFFIILSDNGCKANSETIKITDENITITSKGKYTITGTVSDTCILVDAPGSKVTLLLDGAGISNDGKATVIVKSADKVTIESAADSTNLLLVQGQFTKDAATDSAIFSKEDITLCGNGELIIYCETSHGISSKDTLKLKSGTLNIKCGGKGLCGKDSVKISGGVINIVSSKTALSSDRDKDGKTGFIEITGGDISLTSGKDGVMSSGSVKIGGGNISILSESKAIKCNGDFICTGGSINATSKDDSVHAGNDFLLSGGSFVLSSGNNGIKSGNSLKITSGTVVLAQSTEGLEAKEIIISGGNIDINSSDDGINAGYSLLITSGDVNINAQGDGVDSNGSLFISGGNLCISGPTGDGDCSVDYTTTGTVSGGTIFASGSAGMAVNFDTSSTQCSILHIFEKPVIAGTQVTLYDSTGNIIAQFTPVKKYQAVIISTPYIELGSTYTLEAGGETVTVSVTDIICGSGIAQNMKGRHSDFGRATDNDAESLKPFFDMPDDWIAPPDDEGAPSHVFPPPDKKP